MGHIQGRRTAHWCPPAGMVVLGVLSMTMSLAAAAAAAQYTVGDDGGWTINVNYTDWAVKQTFHEGDTIVFSYQKGTHNVLRVSPEDYESCKVSNPIEIDESGQSSFQLRTGPYYFICGFPAHCDLLQKISFNVEPTPGSVSSPLDAPSSSSIPSYSPAYSQSAETPIAYGPTGAFAPGAAPVMFRPSLLHSLILLGFGCLLGSWGSIL